MAGTDDPCDGDGLICDEINAPENLGDFQLVWLFDDLDTLKSLYQEESFKKNSEELSNVIKFFTKPMMCLDFIKSIKMEYVILILPDTLLNDVLRRIYQYEPLKAIYIFSKYDGSHTELAEKYEKVQGIYTTLSSLLNAVRKKMKELEKEILGVDFQNIAKEKSIHKLSKEQATFFWYKSLFKTIQQVKYDQSDKQRLEKKLKRFYRGQPETINDINNFLAESDNDTLAINWYTKETFLYKILNKCFRQDNVDLMYLFGFYLQNLSKQMAQKQETTPRNEVLELYRGIVIPEKLKNEYQKEIGWFIALKGFVSTSCDENIGRAFAKNAFHASPDNRRKVKVLYKITVAPEVDVELADISELSEYHESEILFCPYAIFRIDSVVHDLHDDLYVVCLTATDCFKNDIEKYFNLQHDDLVDLDPSIRFGRILFKNMREISKAENHFRQLLSKYSAKDENVPVVTSQLADLYACQGETVRALQYYEDAISIYKERSNTQNKQNIDCLLKAANLYVDLKKIKDAELLQNTIENILHKNTIPDFPRLGMLHKLNAKIHIFYVERFRLKGNIYAAKMQLMKADNEIQAAYRIFENLQEIESEHFVSILGDVSAFYKLSGEQDLARKFVRKQLCMARKYLTYDHPLRSKILRNLMQLYDSYGMFEKANTIFEQELKRYKKFFGEIHSAVAEMFITKGDYVEACRMLFKITPLDENRVSLCLTQISQRKQTGIQYQDFFRYWIKYLALNYPSYERRTGDALCIMANIYNDLGEPEKAFGYLNASLRIYRIHHDRSKMRKVEDFMRHIERGSGRLHDANIVCYDNWENGILYLGKNDDDPPFFLVNCPREAIRMIQL